MSGKNKNKQTKEKKTFYEKIDNDTYSKLNRIVSYVNTYRYIAVDYSTFGIYIFDTRHHGIALFWFSFDKNNKFYFGCREFLKADSRIMKIYENPINKGLEIIKKTIESNYSKKYI